MFNGHLKERGSGRGWRVQAPSCLTIRLFSRSTLTRSFNHAFPLPLEFELKILGSASATPYLDRHHTAQILTVDNQAYLIDCGEGTQHRLMEYKIRHQRIGSIFISHLHGDHFFGLFGLLSTMHLHGREQPGTHLLALATNNTFLTLPADSFNTYLTAEELDNILLIRKERGESAKPAREAYRRCTKTLVQVGAPISAGNAFAHVAGLPLELIPEQNPYTLRAGAALTVRVLADGKPLPGALVKLWHRDVKKNVEKIAVRSNQNGRVLFHLSTPGTYLISTMRMHLSADPQMADWQSTWSSLTFGFVSRASR